MEEATGLLPVDAAGPSILGVVIAAFTLLSFVRATPVETCPELLIEVTG
jgi:hypothetical protein